jgi:hypothetical protein
MPDGGAFWQKTADQRVADVARRRLDRLKE